MVAKLFQILTHRCFCNMADGFSLSQSHKCVQPLYRFFINRFEKNTCAGPYGSYDKIWVSISYNSKSLLG